MPTRRTFLWLTAACSGLPFIRLSAQRGRGAAPPPRAAPPSIAALTSMRSQAKPISKEERLARIERARRLMTSNTLDAIVLTGGTSLDYFTGLRWGGGERLFA